MQAYLDQQIQYLSGVGPKRAQLLKSELDIVTVRDMLQYYPYRYIDRTKFYKIREINGQMPYIQLKVRFVSARTTAGKPSDRLNAIGCDGSGCLALGRFGGT